MQEQSFFVITGDDFTIHDTISYDNTAPVVNRIPKGDLTVLTFLLPFAFWAHESPCSSPNPFLYEITGRRGGDAQGVGVNESERDCCQGDAA